MFIIYSVARWNKTFSQRQKTFYVPILKIFRSFNLRTIRSALWSICENTLHSPRQIVWLELAERIAAKVHCLLIPGGRRRPPLPNKQQAKICSHYCNWACPIKPYACHLWEMTCMYAGSNYRTTDWNKERHAYVQKDHHKRRTDEDHCYL